MAMKILFSTVMLALVIGQQFSKEEPKPQRHENSGKPLVSPSAPSIAPSEPSPTPKQDGANREPDKSRRRWLIEPLVANWPLVAVAIPAIFVGWLTLKAMRESSERQLRAYVMAENSTIFNVANPVAIFAGQVFTPTGAEITNPACGPGVRIQIKNAGQTPAYEVAHWANICFREFPLKSLLPARDPNFMPVKSVLGPGIPSTKLIFMPQPLTAPETADLRAGNGAVYVYGEITYRDTFGKAWYTRYRVMHHPYGGAIGVSTDLTFCDEGNEAN